MDATGKAHGFRDRLGEVAKQPRHFVCWLEITLRIGLETFADSVDGRLLPDAGEHILQGAARGMVVQHLVGCEQRHLCRHGDVIEPRQAAPVIAAIDEACGEPHAIGTAIF